MKHRDPRLSSYNILECVQGRWEVTVAIAAPTAEAAALEWIETRPQGYGDYKFKVEASA